MLFEACKVLLKGKNLAALKEYFDLILNRISDIVTNIKLILFAIDYVEKQIRDKFIGKAIQTLKIKSSSCLWHKE